MYPGRILYLNHDNPNPSGGVQIIYDHVRQLVRNGYRAVVVHQQAEFKPVWFQGDVPVLYLDHQFQLQPDDLVIIPEDHAAYLELFRLAPVRKIVFCQSYLFVFDGLGSHASWRAAGITAIMTCSHFVTDFLHTQLHYQNIQTVHNAINPVFSPAQHKKNQITYMPRKRPHEAQFIKNLCNGSSDDFKAYIQPLKPDYFLSRLNLGFDLAGFDALLRTVSTKQYERFILLHDDHWFADEAWLDTLLNLSAGHPEIDIFGNLLDCSEDKLVEHFEIVSRVLGYGHYLEPMSPVFAQGVAGLFTRRAIEIWQQADGVPHINNNLKNVAEICERLASFMLYAAGCSFMQIPPGFQQFLRHRHYDSAILEAPRTIYGATLGVSEVHP
jgi:hypothetical protein